jgi:hypothetical protein
MNKKIVVVFMVLALGIVANGQQKVNMKSPSSVVGQLLRIYKTQNFKEALNYTIGSEKKTISKLVESMNNNFGKIPVQFAQFINFIDDMKLLGETIDNNIARVDVIWILKIKNNKSNDTLIKVNEVAYLLEKVNDNWFIRSSKFLKEHVFYDYQKVQENFSKAKKFQ